MSPRRRHLKAEEDPQVKAVIDAAFESGKPSYEAIETTVLAETGKKVGKSSIQRYWCEWNARRQSAEARDQARTLIAEFKDRPAAEVEQALEALATATIYRGMSSREGEELTAADALAAQDRLARRKLKGQELELKARQVDALERRVNAMEAARRSAQEKVDGMVKSREISEEAARKIREEIYGLPA